MGVAVPPSRRTATAVRVLEAVAAAVVAVAPVRILLVAAARRGRPLAADMA